MHPQGKPAVFTDAENDLMRDSIRALYTRLRGAGKVANQDEFGDLLGVGQQTAGKIVGTKPYGISRQTALAYAKMCGYDSPESLLEHLKRERSRALGGQSDAELWADRDYAMSQARSMGYDAHVLEAVGQRYEAVMYASRPRRWWMDRIVQTQTEFDAEKDIQSSPLLPPPPPTVTPPDTLELPRARVRKRA